MSREYVLWGISYANLLMMFASLPKMKFGKNDKEDKKIEGDSEAAEFFRALNTE